MSFRCEHCKKAQPSGTRPHRMVVLTRPNKHGLGTQIVREMSVCVPCEDVVEAKLNTIKEEMAKSAGTGLTAPLVAMMH